MKNMDFYHYFNAINPSAIVFTSWPFHFNSFLIFPAMVSGSHDRAVRC